MLTPGLTEGQGPLGVAVSGGSDSTALLVALVEARGAQGLHAVTVNHGLRAEAAQEAAEVAALCATLGLSHDTLHLQIPKGGDLQARARRARYGALVEWAQSKGIAAIALGHTRDDLAEGFLIRLARGSGVDGLAAMPAQFTQGGIGFLRPLLNATRAELRDFLDQRGLRWSEDPSNADPAFTRVQMRRAMPDLAELGLTPERLAQTAEWMSAARDVLEAAAEAWIAAHARAEAGDAVLDHAALLAAPEETRARILTRALCAIASNPYRPRYAALSAALAQDKATLHGCLIYRDGPDLRITREERAAGQQQGALWDSRWQITGPLRAEMQIKALGQTGLNLTPNWRETTLLPRLSLLASPSIWQGETLIAAPLAAPCTDWQATAPNPLHLSR